MFKKTLLVAATLGLGMSAYAASGNAETCAAGGGVEICLSAETSGSAVLLDWSKSGTPEKIEIYRSADDSLKGREKLRTITRTKGESSFTDKKPLAGDSFYSIKFKAKGKWYETGVAAVEAEESVSTMAMASTAAKGSKCTKSKGTVKLKKTMVIDGGTFDGGCKTYMPTWGDCSQKEGQKPVFRVNGGTLKNVIIGNRGDGVHVYGDATIQDVTWPDVCEDALTVKKAAKVKIKNITGQDGSDKFIQINAKATVEVTNAKVTNVLKMFREKGGSCYPVKVILKNSELKKINEAIFRSDCKKSSFEMSNTKMTKVKKICKGKASCKY